MKINSYKITVSGLMLAVGLILPFVTSHGLGLQGTVLLPMHIPVLLCGFLCGPLAGALLGLTLPYISGIITGMPVIYPMAVIMCGELCVYGFVSGLLYNTFRLKRFRFGAYPSLIVAMILGRVAYGLIYSLLFLINGQVKGLAVSAAILTGLPGIVIQILFIPAILKLAENALHKNTNIVKSAVNLIKEDRFVCTLIKDGVIIKTHQGRGIAPIISFYEEGVLKGAYVVDKVVGKGAAMVMTLGGIKGCHAITISKSALEWFKKKGITAEYDVLVDHIVNRTGDGMCPMEETVLNIHDEQEGFKALKTKLEELKSGN